MMMANKNVNEMPYSKRRRICEVLDIGDEWKLLAAEIGFSVDKIQHFELSFRRMGGSATSDLLTNWSHSNATIEMLASILLKLDLRRAAEYLRGLVPDSMFDSTSSDDPNSNGSGPDQEFQSLPKPSQMTDDMDLPLPCFPPTDRATDRRQLREIVNQDDTKKQQMNIALQNSDSLKIDQKPPSSSARAVRAETWSENMTPSFEFNLPCQFGKFPKESQSSDSEVFRRHPEETTDIPSFTQSNNVAKKTTPSLQKSVDSDGAVALSNFIICYQYIDIVTATNNFHKDNLLGCGGFGSVFRGNIKKTTFAIKVLHKRQNPTSCRDFLAEINSLLKFRQKNIIMLSGCSVDGPVPCLVYEYMVNGSLQDRLECKNNTKPLPWSIRHGVLKDAAAGLQYLHTVDVKPLIHGDIKSGNILLGAHYEAKISDFGLAKEATGGTVPGKLTHITRNDFDKVYGSRAYLPEEFFTGGYQFNIKTDTYSFGIVIFETCTGERPDDPRREGGKLLGEYVRNVIDSKSQLTILKDKRSLDWPDDLWMEVMTLGQSCTSELKKKRPHMTEVYGNLESLHKDMQLKYKIVKTSPSSDGSLSSPNLSGSEKSYHLSHQSRATPNQSLAAENSMPLDEMSPFDLQKSFDAKNYGNLSKEKIVPYQNFLTNNIQRQMPLQDNSENFRELSIADDGSKKQSALSKARYVSQHTTFWENPEKFSNASEHGFDSTTSCNLNSDEKYNLSTELLQSNVFTNGKPLKIYPPESVQNFENEQKEVAMDKTPGNMFLQWQQEQQVKELKENASSTGSYHNSMFLSEELTKMKNKEFPGFLDSLSVDTNFENEISPDLDQKKKKELPGYRNFLEDYQTSPTEIKQNGTSNYFSSLDQNKNCLLPHYRFLQSNGGEESCCADIPFTIPDFVPPESLELSESLASLADSNRDDSKPTFIAKEDLMRAERLEKLKRLRYDEN